MTILQLTTVARVKQVLTIPASNTADDATLSTYIIAVSGEVEDYLGRKLYQQARTEDHTIKLHQRSIWLEAYPIVTVTSINVDASWKWTGSAITSTAYNYNANTGEVRFSDAYATDREDFDAIRVVYTAGVGLAAGAVIASLPAIALAVDMQVAEDWRRKNDPAIERRGGQSGGATWTGFHRFLPRVQQLLAPHRRMVYGGY